MRSLILHVILKAKIYVLLRIIFFWIILLVRRIFAKFPPPHVNIVRVMNWIKIKKIIERSIKKSLFDMELIRFKGLREKSQIESKIKGFKYHETLVLHYFIVLWYTGTKSKARLSRNVIKKIRKNEKSSITLALSHSLYTKLKTRLCYITLPIKSCYKLNQRRQKLQPKKKKNHFLNFLLMIE